MLTACFASCGTITTDTAETAIAECASAESGSLYPLDAGDVTLTYWTAGQASNISLLNGGDLSGHASWQQALENLGIQVEVTIDSQEICADKVSVMISAGEYYDIMAGFTSYYPSGGAAALDDGVVYNILDYADWCPDYLALVESDDAVRAGVLTDSGAAACFYHLVEVREGPGYGAYIRSDWLEALGLSAPVTVQDWEDTLTAFKAEYDPKYPYLLDSSGFNGGSAVVSAWGVAGSSFSRMNVDRPWYQIDGTVYYGQNTDGLKSYLELMRRWYELGLISRDFTSFCGFETGDDLNAAAAGDAGIWYGFETIDHRWEELSAYESYAYIPIADPVLEEGDTLHLLGTTGMVDQPAAAILTTCQYPELAVAFANYWYSSEGYLLCNYGIEGEGLSFDETGAPQCSQLIMEPADGLTVSNTQFLYSVNFVNGLFDTARAVSYDIGCRTVWGENRDNAYDLPCGSFTMTESEGNAYNIIMADIDTFASESIVKFITGEKSLDDWDEYTAQLDAMGIAEATAIMQSAYDRYLQR